MARSFSIAVLVLLAHSMPSPAAAIAQENGQRLWKDVTGNFQVRAAIIEQTEQTVRLRTQDAREVTVPIERLSLADREYLKSLAAPSDDPFAGGRPSNAADSAPPPAAGGVSALRARSESPSAGPELALPGTGTTLSIAAADDQQTFEVDPRPSPPQIPAAHVQVTATDAYDKVIGPVLADAEQSIFWVSIGRNKSGSPDETRGRIYAVDLKSKSADLVWDQPHAVQVVDHDPASGRTLIIDKLDQFQRGGELVMLQGATSGKPQVLYRRTLPGAGAPGFAPQVEWARMLSGSHVAAVINSVLHVWDLPAAELLYRVEKVSAATPPVLSASQRYLAVPQSGGVAVLDAASGEVCRLVDMGGTLNPGVAFHPGGRLIAMCAGNRYLVWDCVENRSVAEATIAEHLAAHPINWLSPKMFLSQMGYVVHVDLEMSVWHYYLATATPPQVIGDKLLTATTNDGCAVASVAVPHAAMEAALAKLMRAGDSDTVVRPGSSVSLAVEASVEEIDHDEIKEALTGAADKAGWTVDEKAPVTLVAKIGRGEQQTLSYRSLGGGLNQTESTATLTPFTTELEIRSGSNVLWTRATTNHVPSLLRLQEGETVQDAVKRYEKPNPEFFSHLNLPPRIFKPEIASQVGMSGLKNAQWYEIKQSGRPAPGPRPRRR